MKKRSVGAWGRPQPGEVIYRLSFYYILYILFLFLCWFSVMALPSTCSFERGRGEDG